MVASVHLHFLIYQGFGGKFGIETDRVDKSAHQFGEVEKVGTNYTKQKPDIGGAKPSSIRAKFENMAKEKEQVLLIYSSVFVKL